MWKFHKVAFGPEGASRRRARAAIRVHEWARERCFRIPSAFECKELKKKRLRVGFECPFNLHSPNDKVLPPPPKILGQKPKTTTKVSLQEPQINLDWNTFDIQYFLFLITARNSGLYVGK